MSEPTASHNPHEQPTRDALKIALFVLIIPAVLAFWLAWKFVEPAPPNTITIAAGEPDGAYAVIAKRYQERLAPYGVELQIVHTRGSVENVELLEAGDVDIAIVQGGVLDSNNNDEGLLALGSFFYEPLWMFFRYRGVIHENTTWLKGQRISVGPVGSGTHAIATDFLALNDIDPGNAALLTLRGNDLLSAFESDRIDAAVLVANPLSSTVMSLLESDQVVLANLRRAEAYPHQLPFLSLRVLPEGGIDLARNIPREDKKLLIAAAMLVVRKDFHPALTDLMLVVADEALEQGGLFASPGEFPSPLHTTIPVSGDAQRHYEHGAPFLWRYMPFWAATQFDRLKVMLIPLIVVLIPVFKSFPPTYRWQVRRRIYRSYRHLRKLDPGARTNLSQDEVAQRLAEIRDMEAKATQVSAPLGYTTELYQLRTHIDLVRRQLEKLQTGQSAEEQDRG